MTIQNDRKKNKLSRDMKKKLKSIEKQAWQPSFNPEAHVLCLRFYTPIASPANGGIGASTYLLSLGEDTFEQLVGKDHTSTEERSGRLYNQKSTKGMIRHVLTQYARKIGLEVCNSINRSEYKNGTPYFKPIDFLHVSGDCLLSDDECIIHKIFGSIYRTGSTHFFFPPLANDKKSQKSAKYKFPVDKVHIGVENSIVLNSTDKMPIQPLERGYFSGEFSVQIDVSKLIPAEIGFIYSGLQTVFTLGGRINNGYGVVVLKSVSYGKRTFSYTARDIDQKTRIFEPNFGVDLFPLTQLDENIQQWEEYIENTL